MSSTEKHIFISSDFDDVCFLFLNKIQEFHEYFVDDLIISGESLHLNEASDLNMEPNPKYSSEFLVKFLPGILSSDALLYISHINSESLLNKCVIYYVNTSEEIEGFYMTEGFQDLELDDSCLRIYKLREDCNLNNINNFWLDE